MLLTSCRNTLTKSFEICQISHDGKLDHEFVEGVFLLVEGRRSDSPPNLTPFMIVTTISRKDF